MLSQSGLPSMQVTSMREARCHRTDPDCRQARRGHEGYSACEVERMPNAYTAVIKRDGEWWIGWIAEIPA